MKVICNSKWKEKKTRIEILWMMDSLENGISGENSAGKIIFVPLPPPRYGAFDKAE